MTIARAWINSLSLQVRLQLEKFASVSLPSSFASFVRYSSVHCPSFVILPSFVLLFIRLRPSFIRISSIVRTSSVLTPSSVLRTYFVRPLFFFRNSTFRPSFQSSFLLLTVLPPSFVRPLFFVCPLSFRLSFVRPSTVRYSVPSSSLLPLLWSVRRRAQRTKNTADGDLKYSHQTDWHHRFAIQDELCIFTFAIYHDHLFWWSSTS